MSRVASVIIARTWILALTLCCAQAASARGPMTAPKWGGEYLRPDQGLASLEARVENFPGGDEEPLQIALLHVATGQAYIINQPLSSGEKKKRTLYWKLPAGKYQITRVSRVAGAKTLSTTRFRAQYVTLQGFALSDLGVWVAKATRKGPLVVKFFARNAQEFTFPTGDDTLSAIIDGFSGKRLKTLAGGANSERSRVNFGTADEMRATITETREVSMVYKMDLRRFARYNRSVFPVIQKRDGRFRQCYLDGLQLKDNLRGTAKFDFTLAGGKGTVQRLKYKGGTLLDQRTVECLYAELGQMEFPVKVALSGSVTFAFDAD